MRVLPLTFHHVPTSPPGSSSDPRPIYGTIQEKSAAYIEIAASSELDSCIIQCPSGTFVLTLGGPLSVPTEGPYTVRPVRPMPYSNGAPAFLTAELNTTPPQLALNVFVDCAPTVPTPRRGPGYRRMPTTATNTSVDTFAAIFEFPWYGRRTATVMAHWAGAGGTATIRARGNFYDAPLVKTGGGSGFPNQIAGGTGNAVKQSPALLINTASGLVAELTLDSSTNQTFTIAAENFDTIVIEAHGDGSARDIALYVKLEDTL